MHSTLLSYRAKIVLPAFALVTGTSYLFLDHRFALFCNSWPSAIKDLLHLAVGLLNPTFCVLLFSSLFFLVKFVQRREKASRKLWFLSLALAPSILLANTLNMIVGRASPLWFFNHGDAPLRFFQWNPAFHSFPSSSSCAIAALFTSFACLYPSRANLFIALSVFVGVVPSLITECFFSDSLFGIAIGMSVAFSVFKAMKRSISFF